MKIAMIGQKGIPATYGGIERNVEEVGSRLAKKGHEVSVYCRLYYTKSGGFHHGMKMIRLPSLNTKHLDTVSHCLFATVDSLFTTRLPPNTTLLDRSRSKANPPGTVSQGTEGMSGESWASLGLIWLRKRTFVL